MIRKSIMASLVVLIVAATLSDRGVVRAAQRGQSARMMKNSWWSKRSSPAEVIGSSLEDQQIGDLSAASFLTYLVYPALHAKDVQPDLYDTPCLPSAPNQQLDPSISYYLTLIKALKGISRRNKDKVLRY
ncbi:uncharacterized protein [Palaemon carinicauda]|uniref:uncharacterized protein n=1 Tax=Palaemon carinicauda TaxID=392227 RepID=UPI0035B5BE4E